MSKYHGPKEELDAARSPETSVEELRALARSEYNFVRIAVAGNPKTEGQVLEGLFPGDLESDANEYMAVTLAQNSKTTAENLAKLANMVIPRLEHWNSRGKLLQAL